MVDTRTIVLPAQPHAAMQQSPDLDQIFSQYGAAVYRFLYSKVGNREDAEDLTSEVFLKAARHLDASRPEASIAKWLFTVARTVLADHWRQYYHHGPLDDLDETHLQIPEQHFAALSDETARRLAAVLAALPARYRQVLELRFLHGYSITDTAVEMGISPENVRVLQHRALARAVQVGEGLL